MKKTISLVLCITMLMLSVASCLPAIAIELSSVETSENYAQTEVSVPKNETQLFADTVTITFEGDGLVSVPAPLEIATGDVVDLTNYYNVTPSNSKLRFNGWSTDGTVEKIVSSITVGEENITLYPIVNYDINLSIHTDGWDLGEKADQTNEADGVSFNHIKNKQNLEYYYSFPTGAGLPVAEYKQVVYYYEDDYLKYDRRTQANSTYEKFSQTESGDVGQFGFASTVYTTQENIVMSVPAAVTGSNGKTYAKFVAEVSANSKWKDGVSVTTMQLAPLKKGAQVAYNAKLAYIRFIPYQMYEEDIEITGFVVPETNGVPVTRENLSANIANVERLIWDTEFAPDGRFKPEEEYVARLILSPKDRAYQFRSDVEVKIGDDITVSGNDISINPENGELTATVVFPATEPFKAFSFNLDSLTDIEVADPNPIQLEINITEEEPGVDTSVVWSIIEGNDVARITEDGLLYVDTEGTITVQAESKYRYDKVATKSINITFGDSLETVTITFEGNVNNLPEPIERLKGATISLRNYLDCTSAIADKRFNGWTPTGEEKDLVTDTLVVNEDVTLTAVVNYDFNFAIPANQGGWGYNIGTIEYENDYLVIVDNPTGSWIDTNLFTPSNLNLPATKVAKIQYYVHPQAKQNGEFVEIDINQAYEGVYFRNVGDGYSASKRIYNVKPTGYAADGSVIFEYNVYTNSLWDGIIDQLRLDLLGDNDEYKVRYVNIVEKEPFDIKELKIEGIPTPKTGESVPTNIIEANGIGTIKEVNWTPNSFITYEFNGTTYTSFNENTTYSVEIVVSPIAGTINRFADDSVATINGTPANISIDDQGIATITYTYPTTTAFEQFEITVSGPEEITKAARVTQYRATFSGDVPLNTAVLWSVSDPSKAEIDPTTGKLVPLSDGTVTVRATSAHNPTVYGEFDVAISNQGNVVKITYNPGTEDLVTNMPGDSIGTGTVVLSTQVPKRTGYQFLGWATDDESLDTVTMYAPGVDATVYAVWQKLGHYWDFNGDKEGFGASGTINVTDEYLYYTTTLQDWQVVKGDLDINAATENKIQIKFAVSEGVEDSSIIFYQGTNATLSQANTVSGTFNGSTTYVGQGLDNWMIAEFDMASNASWKGTIDYLRFDISNLLGAVGATFRIDYIYVLDSTRNVTFNTNGAGVINMPDATVVEAGDTLSISKVPVRDGYQFVGWAKSANPADGDKIKTSWTIVDDVTFYAIWNPVVTPDQSNPTTVNLGMVTDEAVLVSTDANIPVYLSFLGESGEVNLTQVTNGAGYAVFDLTGVTGTIAGATVSTDEAEINSVSVTSLSRANNMAQTVIENGVDISTQDGLEAGEAEAPKYDMTVTDITTEGKIKPNEVNPAVGGDAAAAAADAALKVETVDELMAIEGPITVNFDKAYQDDFFPTIRRFLNDGRYDSMAMYTNLGLSSSMRAPALYTEEFKMDTTGHNYVVMKVRNIGYAENKVTLNFKTLGGSFDSINEITVENENNGEFAMFVWNMSEVKEWNGYIEGLYFAFGEEKDARTEIDWILFTDEIPESMDEIEGANEFFPVVNRGETPFTDILSTDWFYSDVAQAYKLNFVNGTSETTYSPHGQVTIAEAITLAARLSTMYNGKPVPQAATEGDWYAPFVEAAIEAKIIRNDQFEDYNAPALRREVVEILSNVFDSDYLPAINMFTEIPDLKKSDKVYNTVLNFYNSGILVGDSAHNFNADTYINRSEIAAIINRFADVESRARVVTQAEIESRRKWFYPEDMLEATIGNMTKPTIVDGYLTATTTSQDPMILFSSAIIPEFDGGETTRIVIGMKWDESVLPTLQNNELFFTTPAGASWSADRRIFGYPGVADADGIIPYTFTTTSHKLFNDTITGLRFDPMQATGVEFSIAYIMIE